MSNEWAPEPEIDYSSLDKRDLLHAAKELWLYFRAIRRGEQVADSTQFVAAREEMSALQLAASSLRSFDDHREIRQLEQMHALRWRLREED